MDMKTFKILEFAAIFGALGYFWWNQRQDRLRREDDEQRKQSEGSIPDDEVQKAEAHETKG
ncbi:hypothetical protein [Halochromatium glycolicum]|jgi:uncharacterized protein HemX|uniref:Uncharacterized protein n=1 Tax=Halochromatium glycolicum TaxID=85075 RepID=A0AAJ0U3C3_9GAMM|nr:hypothetical protein [Halochromatium glycolicum]MBK1704528.1 hypothetical protein [Halochromatium glycolicum]